MVEKIVFMCNMNTRVRCRKFFVPDSFVRFTIFVCYLNLQKNVIKIIFGPLLDPARSQLFLCEHCCIEEIIKMLKNTSKHLSIMFVLTYLNLHKSFTGIFFGPFLDPARSQPFWREHFCTKKIIKKLKKASKHLFFSLFLLP